MNRTGFEQDNRDEMPDSVLDELLGKIQTDEPEPAVVEAARDRVWARLAAAAAEEQQPPHAQRIESCAGFQALFAEYREGTLSPARRMLLEDHLHTCVACRKEFQAPKVVAMPSSPKVAPSRRAAWTPARWAIAAALLVSVGSGSFYAWNQFGPAPSGPRARVLTADGGVYLLQGNTLLPVSAGAEVAERAILRTTGDGHASVQLIDGSKVEVGERAEFSVSASRRDTTVHLERGQVIVQAAKRSSGHLYVATPDSRVAVTGTIFSVNRGIAGSRVSVVEGEVHVEHASAKDVLRAGDQVTTHASMARTSVADDIVWSRDYDRYLALLRQFVEIRNKLTQVHMPGLRYSSRLMDAVPAGTTLYVSLPNMGQAVEDFRRIVSDQARQSPELSAWLSTQMPEFERITTQLTQAQNYLGDEVIIAFRPCKGFCGLLIAETVRPGLKEYIETEMAKSGAKDLGSLKIVTAGNRIFIGEQSTFLEAAQQGNSTFSSGALGQTVNDVYRRGAGLFVAADLQTMFQNHEEPATLGFRNVRHFVAEQREVGGKTEYSAVVSFAGQREGVASWLASPGAMGSLGFISPDAQFAASFVAKAPERMVADLVALADGKRPDMQELERMVGLTPEQVAGYLGGELTFAVDGPLLPVPSWKIVLEVRDPVGLQTVLSRLAEAASQQLQAHGQSGTVALKQETVNGRTWYSIQSPFENVKMDIHYTYVDGYLVAAPTRALLERAMRDRSAGVTLARSQEFTSRLPRDSRANFSGMIWQNAGDLMRVLGDVATSSATPEQQKQAAELLSSAEPTLICLYGENDRIEIASQGNAMNLLMQGLAKQILTRGSQPVRTRQARAAYR